MAIIGTADGYTCDAPVTLGPVPVAFQALHTANGTQLTGGSNKRVSLAALIAVKPGCRPRLIYRVHTRKRGDSRKGFTENHPRRIPPGVVPVLASPVLAAGTGLASTGVTGQQVELVWVTRPRRHGMAL